MFERVEMFLCHAAGVAGVWKYVRVLNQLRYKHKNVVSRYKQLAICETINLSHRNIFMTLFSIVYNFAV